MKAYQRQHTLTRDLVNGHRNGALCRRVCNGFNRDAARQRLSARPPKAAYLLGCLLFVGVLGCGSAPVQDTVVTEAVTTEPTQVALTPVAHDGPLQFAPALFECGELHEYDDCQAEFFLENAGSDGLTIVSLSQDVSAFASVGIVEDQTGFSRDLPYQMRSRETLRLLFSYRWDGEQEPANTRIAGAVYVNYATSGSGQDRRAEIPIGFDLVR